MTRPFLIILACLLVIGPWDMEAEEVSARTLEEMNRVYRLTMLDISMQAATPSECERATGIRPAMTISRQDRTNEPFHHRTCIE